MMVSLYDSNCKTTATYFPQEDESNMIQMTMKAPTPDNRASIENLCSAIEEELLTINNNLSDLVHRLSPILMSESPEALRTKTTPVSNCRLGDVLVAQLEMLTSIKFRIADITSRIQL